MQKINNIKEFCKLFKIPIPVEEYFQYYVNTLSNSLEFSDIFYLMHKYLIFEEWLKENGYNNVGDYKMGVAFCALKNHIANSDAYKKFQEFNCPKIKFHEKDIIKLQEGNYTLSIDISSANYQSLKIFDDKNEIKSNWSELCDYLKIHPTIAMSKSFRQVVFGNLNPEKSQKIQHYHILRLVEELNSIASEEEIIYISHDELAINIGTNEILVTEKIEQTLRAIDNIKSNAIKKNEMWMNVKPTIFKIQKLSKNIYIKTFYSRHNNSILEMYKALFCCPLNTFYLNFKKHILNEKIDERDLFFENDGMLAKWVI